MNYLKDLGLTKYEHKIYTSLLRNGRSTSKEISDLSNVPPTAVYPNLRSLIKKQLIQKIESDPTLYESLPPAIALQNFITRKQRELENIKKQTIKEAEALSLEKPPAKEKEIVHLTRGKEFSSAVYNEVIKKVSKTFYVLGWRFEKVGERYNFLKEFKKIIKKGVDVRIIVTGKYEKQKELVKAYQKTGIKLKYFPIDNISILVVDNKECKITLKSREFPEKYNIHILDEFLSQALSTYFLDTWEKAEAISFQPHNH